MMQIAGNTQHAGNKGRGYAESWTSEQLDGLLSEDWLRKMVADIRGGDEKQKDQLPYICPHYAAFRNNHRAQKDIMPEAFTHMTCVDVDDKELVEEAVKQALTINEDEYSDWQEQVLRIAYSARKKVHIYIRIPKGMTIEEAQQAFCKEIGVPYDESCITPERFIYITGKDEEVYRSAHWLEQLSDEELAERKEAYLMRGLDVDGRPLKTYRGQSLSNPLRYSQQGQSPLPQPQTEQATSVSMEAFDLCVGLAGLQADQMDVWGVHNWHANLMAVLSVGVAKLMSREQLCAVVAQRLPNYSQTEDCQKLIDYFYEKYDANKGFMNTALREINAKAQQKTSEKSTVGSPVCNSATMMTIDANKLPIGLKESLKPYPQNMWPALIVGQMPALMALADGVTYRYCDGKISYLGGMAIILGEQASNKSAIEEAVERWLVELRRDDDLVREREDKVREANKRRKANERAQEAPKEVIRVVPITISCSKLLKRLKQSQGHSLYSICTEAETLLKSNGGGSWAQKWDIYRNAFARERWGVDYNSDQSESGDVRVAYSWTILGTPRTTKKMFSGRNESNAENGLSSRMMLSEMPDGMFEKITVFKDLSEADQSRITQATAMLRTASGFYDTPRIRKAIDRWLEEKRIESSMEIDTIKDRFRRRAGVIGFRCGVVFMLLAGKESNACVDFAVKMAEYTLQMQLKVFGPLLVKHYNNSEDNGYTTVNGNIFSLLPSPFTMQDLRRLKGNEFSDGSLYSIISRWKADGWVEKEGKSWTKKK